MAYYVSFFFLVLVTLSGEAQTLKGRVFDAVTHQPIPFCAIRQWPGQQVVYANEAGRFTIPQPVSGSGLIAGFIGYRVDTVLVGKARYIEIFLQPTEKQLDEVVVSGTLQEVQRMESTLPIEVYTPTLFKKTWGPSLLESVSMINGVQPQLNCNVCNTGDIHINGLEGPYTMILLDGMPIVSSLSTVYGLAGIPQALIKRIEVVKGPASTLYGSEAVAGLINVITKDPGSAPAARADISFTSIGEANIDVSTRWKSGKSQSLLGINYFNYSLPKDRNADDFTDVTLQNRISIFNKWNFDRPDGQKSSLAARIYGESRWGGQMNWSPKWRGSDSLYGESIYTNRVELFGTQPVGGAKGVRIDYSYNYHHQDSYYGLVPFLAEQHTAFAQLVYSGQAGNWSWVGGIPIRYTAYDDNSVGTEKSTPNGLRNNPSRVLLPGIFAQADWKLRHGVTLLGGLRFDRHTNHGNIWTPRLAVKWQPHENHTVRISSGTGYRVVNLFTEDHAALSGARDVVIKARLKPEQSWNINAGYSLYRAHKKAFSYVDLGLFYTRFSNQIVADFTTNAAQIIYDNLNGFGISRGVSLNWDLTCENGIKVMLGATWMQVFRALEGDWDGYRKETQLFAPEISGNLALSYAPPKSAWSFDITGKLNGPMRLPVLPNDFRPEYSPTYLLLNCQVTKRLPRSFELYGGCRNLLDFIPQNPIMRPFDPFDKQISIDNPNGFTFDPSYNYAPIQGLKLYAGVRWTLQ